MNPAVQRPLEEKFAALRKAYPDVDWRLLTNDDFVNRIVKPTLDNASDVADSSELFVRSIKLLETAGYRLMPPNGPPPPNGRIQDHVKALMETLLVAHPVLLSDVEKRDLQDNVYCKSKLRLRIGIFALIRRTALSRRYWADRYGDFYVCSQWWKQHHCANAESILAWVEDLIGQKLEHADALRPHAQAFRDYLAGNCA